MNPWNEASILQLWLSKIRFISFQNVVNDSCHVTIGVILVSDLRSVEQVIVGNFFELRAMAVKIDEDFLET